MPHNLFRLQLMETFGNRRQTVLRIGVSALLAIPFIFVNMPVRVKASGIVMVVLFTTFFGAAIAHARLCEDRRFSRLMLLPTSRGMIWLDLILASALGRLVPTLVVAAGFAAFNSRTFSWAALISGAALLCESVLLLTLLGTLTGRLARRSAEIHLFSALICAMIAFVSGVTPGIQKLMWLTNTMSANPIHRLLSALTGLTNGTATVSIPEFILSSIVIGVFALTAILRWTSPGRHVIAQNH